MTKSNKTYDSLLVLEYRTGNKKALALLVKRWHKKMCRQAYWYVKDSEIAKDIAQDSWTVIMKKLNDLKDPNSFGSWILSIVNRRSIDWLRKNKRKREQIESYTTSVTSHLEMVDVGRKNDVSKKLRLAIDDLPIDHKIVLNLFYLENFSINQIADIVAAPKGTVKSRLFNARERLKIILKNNNYEK